MCMCYCRLSRYLAYVVPILVAHMNLQVVAYNPQSAPSTRWISIINELQNAHVHCLSGTGRTQQKKFGPCRQFLCEGFSCFDWGWAPNSTGLNKSWGIVLSVRNDVFPLKSLKNNLKIIMPSTLPQILAGSSRGCEVQKSKP